MKAAHEPIRKPCFQGVLRAHEKMSAILPPTPMMQCEIAGRIIWCKAESLQPIGAFKVRGAWHRLSDLTPREREAGVVAFSSGNHAQGVAWAAARLGVSATIVMPSDAPRLKIDATRALGAEIMLYDRMTEDRAALAAQIAEKRGATLVPSYDDPWVVEGQGSAGLEALDQMGEEPDLVITPCGGGGLASGLALALPNAQITVAEPEGWDDMARSLDAGHIVPVGPAPPTTACDALMTLRVSELTFDVLKQRRAFGVAVSEAETIRAMRYARKEFGLILEPGGSVGLAALLSGKVAPGKRTLVILSGGNIDPTQFATMTGG